MNPEQPRSVASLIDAQTVLVLDQLTVDGQVIISPCGEIDMAGAPLLWERISAAIPDVNERLVIDLSQTTFIDSTALAVFVKALKRLRLVGADLVLRAPNSAAQKVLNITALDQIMTIESPSSQSSREAQ